MRKINNKNGFTLLEVLIALLIFTIGILGVATMQITAIKGNNKGRQISEASDRAADRIETFMSLDYADPALNDTDSDGTNQDADGDGIDDDGGNFGLDDATTATADGSLDSNGDGTNDIFWNVAVDYPVADSKTIEVIVVPQGNGRNITMTIIKVAS